jgi:MFS family permease
MTLTAPFRNRDFRRLFLGRVITNAGDSLFYVAVMWLVFELTGSELFTGLAGFLALAPQGLQFLAGPLVDRVPTRRVLVVTQAVQLGLVVLVPVAAATGHLSVWLLLGVVLALAILNQPGYLAESAAIPRLVRKADLVPANSAFALAHQGVFAGFNAVGGLLIAAVGAVTLFWIDAVSFGLAVVVFSTLHVPVSRGPELPPAGTAVHAASLTDGGHTSFRADVRDGVDLVRGSIIAPALVGPALVYFAAGGALAVFPAYAVDFGGASAYGLLVASIGGGLLLGAGLAGPLSALRVGRLMIVGLAVSAVVWVAGVAVGGLAATVGLLLVAFVPIGAISVLLVSTVQAIVPEGVLGRVLGLVVSITSLAMPVGSLVGGTVSVATSPRTVLFLVGVTFALCSLYVLAVPELRRLPRVHHLEPLGSGGR